MAWILLAALAALAAAIAARRAPRTRRPAGRPRGSLERARDPAREASRAHDPDRRPLRAAHEVRARHARTRHHVRQRRHRRGRGAATCPRSPRRTRRIAPPSRRCSGSRRTTRSSGPAALSRRCASARCTLDGRVDDRREQYNRRRQRAERALPRVSAQPRRAHDGDAARRVPVLNAMRIATWNVNSLRVRMDHLRRWLADNAVDAFALQELKLADEHFPRGRDRGARPARALYGQKTYNGVAILSRRQASDVALGMPADADPQRRVIAATFGAIRLVNVYVPNGQAVGSEKYTYKLAWLERLRAYLAALLAPHVHAAGRRRFQHRAGRPRRARPGGLGRLGPRQRARARGARENRGARLLRPVPPLRPAEEAWSWWDYRMNAFRRDLGLRIDLMLASPASPSAARPARSTAPRGPGSGPPTTPR